MIEVGKILTCILCIFLVVIVSIHNLNSKKIADHSKHKRIVNSDVAKSKHRFYFKNFLYEFTKVQDSQKVEIEVPELPEFGEMPREGHILQAASVADPGVCQCPVCDEGYWAEGSRLECPNCKTQFDTYWSHIMRAGIPFIKEGDLSKASGKNCRNCRYGYRGLEKGHSNCHLCMFHDQWKEI